MSANTVTSSELAKMSSGRQPSTTDTGRLQRAFALFTAYDNRGAIGIEMP